MVRARRGKRVVSRRLLDTLLCMLRAAEGTTLFRTFYADVDGKKTDIMRKGDLSCAFFVSFMLAGLALAKNVHGTVSGTIRDLEESGWKRVRKPRPGAVIVWGAREDERGESHTHIGFYLGPGKAVSNDSKTGSPRIHPYGMGGRTITALYAHPDLA